MDTKPLTLADCGETLTIKALVAVLQISLSQYYLLKAHGVFPIAPLDGLGGKVLYSKTAVQRYLDAQLVRKPLRRSA